MSICKKYMALEALVAGALATGVATLWAPADPWLGNAALHPAWIAVLALAARYGRAGLLVTVPVVWGTVALGSLFAGAGLDGAGRLLGVLDVSAFGASALVASVASIHHGRQEALRRELSELDERARAESEAAGAMRDALATLRDRHDRIDLSVSFWRDIADRVKGGDASDAARAALELAMVRTGARAGIVRRRDDDKLHTLAWRGAWTLDTPIPRDIFPDATIAAAIERRGVATAAMLDTPGAADSDVAAAVVSGDDVLGVIALRGAPGSRLVEAALRDLEIIAGWIAPGIQRAEDPTPAQAADTDDGPWDEPALAVVGGSRLHVASGSGPTRTVDPVAPRPAKIIPMKPRPARPRPVPDDDGRRDRIVGLPGAIPAVPAPPARSRTKARRKGGAPRGRRRTYGPDDYEKDPKRRGRSIIWG